MAESSSAVATVCATVLLGVLGRNVSVLLNTPLVGPVITGT